MISQLDIAKLRTLEPSVLAIGSHRGIIQSMLDFDYLSGRSKPSVSGIVATGRNSERYFFGRNEIVIPVYGTLNEVAAAERSRVNLLVNVSSGRRVLDSTREALRLLPNLIGGVVFAEGFPERHALELERAASKQGVWLLGGASVGIVVPGQVKLGAIGGVQAVQLEASRLFTPGSVAVVSSSGGMVNEIIRTVATSGHGLSFALAVGGERFPMVTPEVAFLAAEADTQTKAIAYFGELGGQDEYQLVNLIQQKKVTKPVVAYIAGTVADLFAEPPQFGHAKAMATSKDESARAKAEALRAVGVNAATTYHDFVTAIDKLESKMEERKPVKQVADLADRKRKLIASSLSYDDADGNVQVLGEDLLSLVEKRSFAALSISMFLGRSIKSKELENFCDYVLRLLIDHGPYVSGAVNTIVAARAGRDLVSSLSAGLLTVGPRFGGAINQAAAIWLEGVTSGESASVLVERYARRKQYISGIGHRKYRIDQPDPRVKRLLSFSQGLKSPVFTAFSQDVEAETTRKKGNLILNVDGAIAAVLLDILHEKEGYSVAQLQKLVDAEFFNALFVLSRSVGFMAHYFDQSRLDEGLFRLGDDDVSRVELT